MNDPSLPPATSRTPASTPAAREAARRLLAELAPQLAAEERQLESPEFDELLAAAEGRLDDAGRLLWHERVERQPELARRAAVLAEMALAEVARARAAEVPDEPEGRLLTFAERRGARLTGSRWFAPLAATAALLVALALQWSQPKTPEVPVTAASVATAVDDAILFADGFEQGSLAGWRTPVFGDGFESGSLGDWTGASPSG